MNRKFDIFIIHNSNNNMEVIAKSRHLHIAPRKVRLVIDLVRGMKAENALSQLKFVKQKAALPIVKLIDSAIANAEHNFKLKKENLYIKKIFADQGQTMKRTFPRARGMANIIRKKTSHITVVLDEVSSQSNK